MGLDLHRQTVGIIGTGKIGTCVARILRGFGCTVLAYDPVLNSEMERLGRELRRARGAFARSDIITLHCPLMPETHHLINEEAIARMKRGVMLINTSRGALIDAGGNSGSKAEKLGPWPWMSTKKRRTCSTKTFPTRSFRTTYLPGC